MGDYFLALFDCAGIQSYVFASNRLRENIGASHLVMLATSEWIDESVIQAARDLGAGTVALNWTERPDALAALHDAALGAEILFQGGGNAAVLFRVEDVAWRCLEVWSERLIRHAPGIAPAAAVVPLHASLHDALADAHRNLAALKRRQVPPARLEGLSLTRACAATGLAATQSRAEPGGEHRWLSASAAMKWDASGAANERLKTAFKGAIGGAELPLNFDELGGQRGASHIAVVHADGNSMGERFRSAADHDDLESAVAQLRNLSLSVNQAGTSALKNVLAAVVAKLDSGTLVERGISPNWADKRRLPLRPLVYGGDDVTLVCDGRLGLTVAAMYLRELSKQIASDQKPLSACAGVAIVHSHFPFGRAYAIAEGASRSAKKKLTNANCEESWLDFHISLSGATGDLDDVRKGEYRSGDNQSLLWRPWRVTPCTADDHDWAVFEDGIALFQGRAHWPRSKAKELRAALMDGLTASEQTLSAASSRNRKPISVFGQNNVEELGWTDRNDRRRTPYFDMLEAMDFYVNLEELQ